MSAKNRKKTKPVYTKYTPIPRKSKPIITSSKPALRNVKTVLLMDDEPHNLDFLVEYMTSKSLKVVATKSLLGVLSVLESNRYRFCLFDLSVPLNPSLMSAVKAEGPLYVEFPASMRLYRRGTMATKPIKLLFIQYTTHLRLRQKPREWASLTLLREGPECLSNKLTEF